MTLVAFGFCVYFGVSKSYEPMWILSLLCFASLVFANLDRIKRFKVDKSGFEAETREIVKEARNTIKELQDLSKIMATITLGLVKRTGRWGGGYSYEEKEDLRDSVLNILLQIGVSDEECEEIITGTKWHQYVELDYVHHLLGGSHIPSSLPEEKIGEWKQLRKRGLNNLPSPEELTRFLEQCELLNPNMKELIEDYEHYIRFREQRRPSVWKDRGNWFSFLK